MEKQSEIVFIIWKKKLNSHLRTYTYEYEHNIYLCLFLPISPTLDINDNSNIVLKKSCLNFMSKKGEGKEKIKKKMLIDVKFKFHILFIILKFLWRRKGRIFLSSEYQ